MDDLAPLLSMLPPEMQGMAKLFVEGAQKQAEESQKQFDAMREIITEMAKQIKTLQDDVGKLQLRVK